MAPKEFIMMMLPDAIRKADRKMNSHCVILIALFRVKSFLIIDPVIDIPFTLPF